MVALLPLAAPISLGPVSLSLPELGQALTRAGMPTEVSASLKNRGAFVCLKNRTPESTRKLLGEALGVAFRPEGATWRMVVDPEAKDRERLFLVAYKRQALEAARAWAAEQDRFRAGRGYEQMDEWVRAEIAALEREKAFGSEQVARVKAVSRVALALSPAFWCGIGAARDAAAVSEAIERPTERTVALAQATRTNRLPAVALQGASAPRSLPTALSTRWNYSPLTGMLSVGLDGRYTKAQFWTERMSLPAYRWEMTVANTRLVGTADLSNDVSLSVESPTLFATFDRMGSSPSTFYRSFEPPAALPAEPVAEPGSTRTLSSILDRLDVEAVMELSVRFEAIPPGPLPERVSLRDLLLPRPAPQPAASALPAWAQELQDVFREQTPPRERAYPWLVRKREGVWLLVNPVAFLDRTRWASPAPYLRVERVLADLPDDAPRGYGGERLPTWAMLSRIVHAAEPESLQSMRGGYRQVQVVSFESLASLVIELERWTPDERNALWATLKKEGKAKVARPDGTLDIKVEALRNIGLARPVAYITASFDGPGAGWSASGPLDPKGFFE